MASIAPTAGLEPRSVPFRPARRSAALAALILLAAAVLIRARQFGNPVIQIDEQFYLLVGDRMLHGAVPYVDIWDRKPVGLFLLYAAIRMLGGTGVLAYQLVATLFAAATALVVAWMARRFAGPVGALAGGVAYLLGLQTMGGDGGQSPVFFDLPTAIAALIVLRQIERGRGGARLTANGCAAMLLLGCAMQIKYTVMFEGVYLGAVLAWLSGRRDAAAPKVASNILLWVAVALLPTALAAAWYWGHGALPAFFDANFVSIFQRDEPNRRQTVERLLIIVAALAPLLSAGAVGLAAARRRGVTAAPFVAGWVVAACGGVLIFGSYYDHYALPVFVPASVALASLTRAGRGGRRAVAALLALEALAGWAVVGGNMRRRGDGAEVARLAARIGPAPPGCLFVFSGDPVLYQLTNACFVTRYVFPTHLNHMKERRAVGDPVAELAAAFRARPQFVVTTRPAQSANNPAAVAFVDARLAQDYRLVLAEPFGKRRQLLFERRAALPPVDQRLRR